MNLRLDIQGLRALAVLLVILFHVNNKWLPGGFVGVDIFFVISGYLISKSIFIAVDNKNFHFFKFFEGRVKRIVPNYFFMLLVIIPIAAALYITTDYLTFFHQFKRAFLFISNQLFAVTDDYFGAKSFENPLLHTWSLSIEMQFYLFLPIIIYFLPKSFRVKFFVITFLLLTMYTEYNLRVNDNKAGMYFALLSRALEFMFGIGVNLVPYKKFATNSFKGVLSFVALITIMCSAFFLNEKSLFPGVLAFPACFATAFIILVQSTKVNGLLSHPLLVYIGKISFALYLYHWPVLALYRYHAMRYQLRAIEVATLAFIFTALSVLSFYLIEENFRKLKRIQLYAFTFLLTLLLGILWILSPKLQAHFAYVPEIYTNPRYFNNNNHNQYTKYELLGDLNKPDDKILLIGDSHGLGLLPFMEQTGKLNYFNFSAISMNHYPPMPGLNIAKLSNTIDLSAYKKLSRIADSIIKKSRTIILVKYWTGNSDFEEAYDCVYKALKPNQNLIILSDIPHLDQNPVRKYKSLTKPLRFAPEKIRNEKFSTEVLNFAKGKANVYFFDINSKQFFKEAPYFNDTLMYIDESHINVFGSLSLVKYKGREFSNFLSKIQQKSHKIDILQSNKSASLPTDLD